MATLFDDFEAVMQKLEPFLLKVVEEIQLSGMAQEMLKVFLALPMEAKFPLFMKYVKKHEKLLGSQDTGEAEKLLAGFLPENYHLLKPEHLKKGWKYAEVLLLILAEYEK